MLTLATAGLPAVASSASPGQLYAFGDNNWGQLGNPTNNKSNEPNPTPALVTLPSEVGSVTQVAAGGGHSLAVTSSGQLYAFGENYYGELGNSTNSLAGGEPELAEEPNPTPALVTLPSAAGTVIQVAAGRYHSLAVTSSGQLYAFGDNNWGQLGNSTNANPWEGEAANPTPALVTLPGASGAVIQAAGGAYHSLAITSSGQLYAFGENDSGQLGNSTNDATSGPFPLQPNPTPALVTLPGAGGPVTGIAAGNRFSLAVTSSGQLYAFGENRFGQLGSATNDQTTEPNPTPTLVTLPEASGPVTQAAAGFDFSLALTSTGQLFAFGENSCGQLGSATNNRTEAPNPTPTRVTLPGASGPVTRIAAGNSYSLALTSTGQLFAFGCDAFGELGTPPGPEKLAPHPTPVPVTLSGGASIETMATGCWANHTLAVVADLAVSNSSLPAGEVGVPYSAQAEGTGGTPPYNWSATGLPPGLSIDPESGAISGTPSAAGEYQARLTLTDSYGIETSRTLAMSVRSPEAPREPPPPPGETPSPPRETSPPVVQNASESARRWREGDELARISRRTRPPTGTTFSFSLNEQATVSFEFVRLRRGSHRRPHGRRRAKGSNGRAVTRGTLSFAGRAGVNHVAFAGRISRAKKLKPGRYRLIIAATNTTGQRSAPVSLRFVIVG